MFGLVVMEGITLSGHLSNINEMVEIYSFCHMLVYWCFVRTLDGLGLSLHDSHQ